MITNVTSWLEHNAKKLPNKIVFSEEHRNITFSELQRQAKGIASRIVEKKLFKMPILIYMENNIDAIVSFLGVAYSCNFYSPIDINTPEERMNKILEVLKPTLVITTAKLKADFEYFEYFGDFLIFDEKSIFEIQYKKIEKVQCKGIDTDLLYVMFTSGSTGIPKGVAITHRSMIDFIDWVTEKFNITQDDSFGNQAPFYFDMSVLDIYSTIKAGATNYIIPKNLFTQPVLLLEFLKSKEITTISWVPSALIMVAKLKALKNVDLKKTLKRVLFCGEVMPNKQLNIWRMFLPNVLYVNLYGPTEITHSCTYFIVDREFSDDEPLPIGFPMANTDILLLDDKNEMVSGEEIGELCVRGTSLSMGYYNNPEKTQEVFTQNPLNPFVPETIYRTGDLAKYNKYGEIIYLGRKDFQIKHMGFRIELGEIELAVSSIDEISICCCLYDERNQKITLFIDVQLEKSYIQDKISKLIPRYMLPDSVIILEKFPMNANGKIDRITLGEILQDEKWKDRQY